MSNKAIEFLRIKNEFVAFTNRENFESNPLPNPTTFDSPIIHLRKEDVLRFRNNYAMLLNFASYVCNKDPKDLCSLDMIDYIQPDLLEAMRSQNVDE